MDNDQMRPRQMPTDTPLLHVLAMFEAEGFNGQFSSAAGGHVHCHRCGAESPASAVEGNRIVRLEGVSDPADMLMVLPVRCPACGSTGTVVANYGPEATPEDAELLVAVERRPSGDAVETSGDELHPRS